MKLSNLLNKNINTLEIIDDNNRVFKCDKKELLKIIEKNKLNNYKINYLCKNSKCNLLDYKNLNCRIEPGAIIREGVILEDNVIVMMGAIINVGAVIGKNTMVDMGAVIGSKAKIGKNCHIASNVVVSGVLEPIAKQEVIIEDNVFIGANSVIFEGVRVGKDAIIGAGSIVTKDVPCNTLVYGNPAKVIKDVNAELCEKIQMNLKIR